MIIKTWRDPYDSGFSLTTPKLIEINPGFTVLVGCNGAGKTTLLLNIEDECRIHKIPVHKYDNLQDGGNLVLGGLLAGMQDSPIDSLDLGICMFNSSEGETIKLNVGRQSYLYSEFLSSGHYKNSSYKLMSTIFDDADRPPNTNQRVLLYDATDSGVSIDAICEMKTLFKSVIEDANTQGIELYIIISANEYELCREENCFDVNAGKYLRFTDYEDYRKFIIASRQIKEKRIDKQVKWREKQVAKEMDSFAKLKESHLEKKSRIQQKADAGICLTWDEREILSDSPLKTFIRESRFLSMDLLDKEG